MKNRLPIIILAVALPISLGGNVYLITKQSTLNNQLTDVNNLLAEANNQIADLENQLSDYENLKTQLADLQEQLDQLNQLSQNKESDIKVGNNAVGEDAIPETDEDKALAEQAKQEAESTSTPQPTEKPQAEVDFPELPPEIAYMFEGPGRIDENTPGYWDVDASQLGEGDYSKGNGMIVH